MSPAPAPIPERRETKCPHGHRNAAMCVACQYGANAARATVWVGVAGITLVAALLGLLWIVARSATR